MLQVSEVPHVPATPQFSKVPLILFGDPVILQVSETPMNPEGPQFP